MRIRLIAVLTVLLLLAPAAALAQGFRNLTAEELKKKIDEFERVKVVDTRTAQEYGQGHIPGAINVPPQQFDAIAEKLPPEKNYPLVFYCRGYT